MIDGKIKDTNLCKNCFNKDICKYKDDVMKAYKYIDDNLPEGSEFNIPKNLLDIRISCGMFMIEGAFGNRVFCNSK